MNILIIDSDHEHRKTLVRLLAHYGMCDAADKGLDGIRAFLRAFDEHNPYDLVMIDADYPRIDSAAMLATMRFMERQFNTGSSKIFIGLSPDSPRLPLLREDDRWDALFMKPYNEMDIVKALQECRVIPARSESTHAV